MGTLSKKKQYRGAPNDGQIVLLGYDSKGNIIEIIAVQKTSAIVIYHAMTPPSKSVLRELDLEGSKR